MLSMNVRVGETISFNDRNHGLLGSMRVDHKSGNSVRLIFDVIESLMIRRMMNHQESKTSFGITGEALSPLRQAV
jgi:hypothetical protein